MRLSNLLPLLLLLTSADLLFAQPRSTPDEPVVTVRNLETVNSPEDEYSPYITPSGTWLYVTSSRDGASSIYRSRYSGDAWGDPEHIRSQEVNTVRDDGAFSAPIPMLAEIFTLDADAMRRLGFPGFGLLTSAGRPDGVGDADLYVVDVSLDGVDLDNVRPLHLINTDGWEAQGAVAPDASFIIFSSDRSGGKGGMDLYMAVRNASGEYAEAVNLGPTVNTSGNEFAPFISPDGSTLFFASTGHAGFGGSDIFMSKREKNGVWGAPINLGDKINTAANELFFFGVGRERCLFVSDRPGGKGGLDIYEIRPNIFNQDYATVEIKVLDTTTGKPVQGRVRVVEPTLDRTVTEVVMTEQGAEATLFPALSYRLEFSLDGFPAVSRSLSGLAPNGHTTVTIKVGSVPPQPEFVLDAGNLDLPWFVSGYYRINTPALLADLRQRQEQGDLKHQKYIANVAKDAELFSEYTAQAERVQKIISAFYRRAVEEYFPGYLQGRKEHEYLEITVYGFADPRGVTGRYSEMPVTFYDMGGNQVEMKSGEKLTNFKLGGLRAYYAVQYFDRLFRQAAADGYPEYSTLADRGLIRWRAVSGDVDTSDNADLSQLRRVQIDFRRVDPDKPDLR